MLKMEARVCLHSTLNYLPSPRLLLSFGKVKDNTLPVLQGCKENWVTIYRKIVIFLNCTDKIITVFFK